MNSSMLLEEVVLKKKRTEQSHMFLYSDIPDNQNLQLLTSDP